MKSPRFLAALAMAAVLTTGTTAHAAFNQVGGSATNGQTPMQETEVFDPNTTLSNSLTSQGDISVDGTFTKTVNNFPTPTKDGHYLRVTMPIKMDFTYDVDHDLMTAAQGTVVNNSVHADGIQPNQPNSGVLTPKKVSMSIVGFDDNLVGTQNLNDKIVFVNNAVDSTDPQRKIELPFQLNITGKNGTSVTNYTIKNIKDKHQDIKPIVIPENSAVKLELDTISGQTIANADLINNQTSLTSHNLKLKFEYMAN